jgi:hypothetical protein
MKFFQNKKNTLIVTGVAIVCNFALYFLYKYLKRKPNPQLEELDETELYKVIKTVNNDTNIHHQMIGSEFPKDSEGRTYHLDTKKGEVTNRIICVGDLERAKRYSDFIEVKFSHVSSRGFATYSGIYNNVPVTIIGTG